MAGDFGALQAAFDAAGVDHLVFGLESGLGSQATQDNLARVHCVPEDVVEAGGFASGININGVLMFFDASGRYVGSADTTRAEGSRFERPRRRSVFGEGICRAEDGAKDGE